MGYYIEVLKQFILYLGDLCTEHDYCADHPCGQNGRCESLYNDYRCECEPGYTGPNCQIDVDECRMQRNPCSNRGKCINTLGSYQ